MSYDTRLLLNDCIISVMLMVGVYLGCKVADWCKREHWRKTHPGLRAEDWQ